MKRFSLIISGLYLFISLGLSQNVSISATPNHYLRVDAVSSDRVSVTETMADELDNFLPGDIVMIIQMSGVTLDNSPGFLTKEQRVKKQKRNAGRYEVLQLNEVIISASDTVVVFTDNLANTYDAGEKIQLVKFFSGENVTVNGLVTAHSWDGEVGGVVAIIGTDTVKLDANINVSGQGFRGGAMPVENYSGDCRNDVSATVKDILYFLPSETGRSGYKGEGIVTKAWPYTMGTAFNYSGGGGGNGLYSGGGGGSNYREGGDGGQQSAACTDALSVQGGWGGVGCFELYGDTGKIILGGGGGSGTQLNLATPSPGGNGGGIVIIITGTLVGNGGSIFADGQNATNTAGSGGGGGAGGTVLIDVTHYLGSNIPIQIRGGNGASTNNLVNCTGAGGGGSGGVIWHSGSSIAAAIDSARGQNGSSTIGCLAQGGDFGNYGTKLKKLILPLNGFLFNTIRGRDTICAGQVPGLITASQPKGGDGVYNCTWEQSKDSITWTPAIGGTGVTDLTFQPPALDSSLYYRRVVKSDTITDISREVKIFVYPAIGSNTITGEDTLCYNGDAKPLKGAIISPTGGNNAYNYQWHQSIDQAYWDTVGYEASFDPGALITTIYYRRVVNSTKYCYDTSNTVIITVLPSITNNLFSSDKDTSICMNTSPGTLNTMMPAGGNETFTYSWQYKTIHGNWTNVQDSNGIRLAIGALTDTTSYRRIVYSGNDDACIDTMQTGDIKTIIVRSPIANNGILGAPVQYTCFNTPFQLQGSAPQQGFLEYTYQWEQSSDNSAWETLSTVSADYRNYLTANLIETSYFRRTVYSSASLRECADTSNVVEVRINPLPEGNVINSNDELCAGETLFVKFNVTGNSPFNVIINGASLGNSTKTNVTNTLDSVGFVTTGPASFIMFSIEDDSSCFANPANFVSVTPATVYDVPVAYAGNDAEACSDSYDLQASKDITGSLGLWTATGATFEDAADQNSRVTIDSYGPKVFTWTETNWRCTDTDEVTVIFYEEPQAPNAGPDQVLEFNYLTQLQALPASVGKGKWTIISGSGEFSNDTLPDAVVSELASNNSLKWTVTNGNCDAVADSMNILINPLKIIKAFTPNGDTDNPGFELGADNAEKITLKVFNSSGVLVYESDDYQQDGLWEGKNMDGVDLPEGTYYYVAYIKVAGKEQEVQFRSFVEIIR